MEKEYIATLKLGIKTDTWDITGKIIEENIVGKISKKSLADVLSNMKGSYIQKIPAYSAKKKMGKHLYDYARRGVKIEEMENEVIIYNLELMNFDSNEFRIKICCSSGTYIRSIASDLGEKLGCGAVLYGLKRTKIGKYSSNDAVSLNMLVENYANINYDENLNGILNCKYFIPVKEIADKKKIIYVYGKYQKMLADNSPLYGYMVNINKTKQKEINENDVFFIKSAGFSRCFLHKSIEHFNTVDIFSSNKKLTKSIVIEDLH